MTPVPLDMTVAISNRPKIQQLAEDNEFLARTVSACLKAFSEPKCRFHLADADGVVDILYRSGAVNTIHGFNDFRDPMVFWDLLDAARAFDPSETRSKWICGLFGYWRKIAHTVPLDEEYDRLEKSIGPMTGTEEMLRMMCDHRVTRYTYFSVAYTPRKTYLNHGIVLDYVSGFLRERVVRTLKGRDLKFNFKHDEESKALLEGMERFFDDPASIRSYVDFTPERLSTAIARVKKEYPENTLVARGTMKYIFWIWQDLMNDFPDYDFFKDSYLYNAEMVLNYNTPLRLAEGYRIRVAGREGELPPDEKVLFVVHRDDRRTSTGTLYKQKSACFTRIKDLHWRKALVNYAQHCILSGNDQRYNSVGLILEQFLEQRPTDRKPYHLTAPDARLVQNIILDGNIIDRTKGGRHQMFFSFCEWCARYGYITLEPRWRKNVRRKKVAHRYTPKALSNEQLTALDQALIKMGKENPRYLLDRCIVHLMLLTKIRTGQLCALEVSSLEFYRDGTAAQWGLTKNTGKRFVKSRFSTMGARYLRLAMELSHDLRASCPVGGPKDDLFIYKNRKHQSWFFHRINTGSLNRDLERVCKKAGIEKIASGNIRDTMITARKKKARKEGLDAVETGAFVGHNCVMSTNSYEDIDFRDVLTAADNVYIGKK